MSLPVISTETDAHGNLLPSTQPGSPCTPRSVDTVPFPQPISPLEQDKPVLDNIFNFKTVSFQVENCIFQVLKNGFNVSGTVFEHKFSSIDNISDLDESKREGGSTENPIKIYEVSAAEFRIFLRILYPFISFTPISTYDEWICILKLATMWGFEEVRSKAIQALNPSIATKEALDKISIGRAYHVIQWVNDGYMSLCEFKSFALPKDQWARLGWSTTAEIFQIRENHAMMILSWLDNDSYVETQTCHKCQSSYGPNTDRVACTCEIQASIDNTFRTEFSRLEKPPKVTQNAFTDPSTGPPVAVPCLSAYSDLTETSEGI